MSSNPPSAFRRSNYSNRCSSPEEYWSVQGNRCVQCKIRYPIKPGHEFSSNCGQSDDGGMHEVPYKKCSAGTFNNGNFIWCHPCSICPSSKLLSPCTDISDSSCCGDGDCTSEAQPTTTQSTVITTNPPMTTASSKSYTETTIFSETIQSTYSAKTTQTDPTTTSKSYPHRDKLSVTTLAAFTISILLCACLLCLIYIIKKKKHGGCREMKKCFSERRLSNHVPLADSREHFKLGITEDIKDIKDINDLLSPEIKAAPLQSVLNNMDVVEELVLLLDPDIPGVKNTRHLAASCSIPFTWINYAYSMKDSRSPLIAVLERVIAKYPCWNVGHLADLLSNIGRNDAVAVLGKLYLTAMEV
ncbi:IGF-like family receptor 1 isoform X1 [Pygocentrus nattereri]|uniref:TNFR-Cys domain-containing protein n=1 Tax=Pygocentrus nattereri TaxID=42514 RepID=A0A3B4C9S1_PYGNA|nr:IGF-like family receptor 1 isoform X1 [Pygocentrus nattereri]